jgi:LysM repeat protein
MCDVCDRGMTRRAAVWGLAAAGLSLIPEALADKVYVVQKKDTLTSIAEKHKVPVARLAEHNRLTKPDAIKPGQRLNIPPVHEPPPLPVELRSAIDSARVRSGRWKYVVIHHSGTDMGSAKGMDEYHRTQRHMENGLAYHFVIGNGQGMGDGTTAIGHRWTGQINGGHLASEFLNAKSLGICLVGNFDASKPTEKQLDALHALVAALMTRCKLSTSAVKTHQQINTVHTRCPGKLFPVEELLKRLRG